MLTFALVYAIIKLSQGGVLVNTNKVNILIENGSFNKNAASISNPLFKSNSYFDPQDIVQVKYEMLRAVKNNELNVSAASKQFGFSRTAYYKIEKRFNEAGTGGLYMQKTGPKFPAKVTSDIIEFASELKEKCPSITNDKIVKEIEEQKGVSIHKRSLQRIQAKKKQS
jgi:transposase